MKPHEYHAIRMWHKETGSMDYYISDLQLEASHDNAPADAIYKKHGTETWVCVSDLAPDHDFRQRYESLQEKPK